MLSPQTHAEIADALHSIAHTRRYRRVWQGLRIGMMVVLSLFLALLLTYTGLAFATGASVWYWSFLLIGDAVLIALLVTVIRYTGITRLFDTEIAKATQRLHAAGYRPAPRDEAAVEVDAA